MNTPEKRLARVSLAAKPTAIPMIPAEASHADLVAGDLLSFVGEIGEHHQAIALTHAHKAQNVFVRRVDELHALTRQRG